MPNGHDVARTLELAGQAIGERLLDGVPLGGSRRSLVLRASRVEAGGTVIVKRFEPEPEPDDGPNGYQREVAGLRLLERTPTLLGSDDAHEIVVMSDIGEHRMLSDLLRGEDADAAWAASLDWARTLGEVLGGSSTAVEQARQELGLRGGDREPTLRRVRAGIEALADAVEIEVPEAVLGELERIGELLRSEASLVVSPGDMCPDNALLTPEGPMLLDLEATTVRPIAFDAAYAAAPFPTCWCVYDQPSGFADALLGAVREGVEGHAPELIGPHWESEVLIASVGWALWMAPVLLRHAVDPDKRMGPADDPALTMRQLLLLRLDWVAERAAVVMPETAALAAHAHGVLQMRWGGGPVPVYPAWAGCC